MTSEEVLKSRQVTAPFTIDQVESLNEFQRRGRMHPFTCGQCRDNLGTRFVKIPEGIRLETQEDSIQLAEWVAVQGSGDVRELLNPSNAPYELVVLDRLLVATPIGWVCPTCDYTQDWAWDWMANWAWWGVGI